MIHCELKYRFELFVPIKYPDGAEVESDKIDGVRRELLKKLRGVRVQYHAPFYGWWISEKEEEVPDEGFLFIADGDRSTQIIQWFQQEYIPKLRADFKQESIYLTMTEIFWL